MKKLILVLVLSVFVVGLGASSAMADSIMFPWLVKSNTVVSLVSVVNTARTSISTGCQAGFAELHYQYYYKEGTGDLAENTASCTPLSITRATSMNDLVTFDASGAIDTGNPLFNDSLPAPDVPNSEYLRFHMAGAPEAARAFLLVDNNDSSCYNDSDIENASLYGEALIVEVDTGAAWGYVAFNSELGGPNWFGDETLAFVDGLDTQGEVLRSPRYYDSADDWSVETTPTVLMPIGDSKFTTKMMVTPVNYAAWEENDWDASYPTGPGARSIDSNSRIEFCIIPTAASSSFPFASPCTASGTEGFEVNTDSCQPNTAARCVEGGIYDNDEGPWNSALTPNVVCTGALNIATPNLLLNQAQIDYMSTQPGGQAWTFVRSMVGSYFGAGELSTRDVRTMSDSIIGKVEYMKANASIASGFVVPGATNDMKWIRNSASLSSGDWDYHNAINAIGQDWWAD